MIQKRFPALLKVHVQLFQFSLDVWQAKEGIVNLCKRTTENEDGKTCDKRDNNMFEKIFSSRQNSQVLALSRLSGTNVLSSSSICRPVGKAHHFATESVRA